jgi:hypothetical protein
MMTYPEMFSLGEGLLADSAYQGLDPWRSRGLRHKE